MAPRALFDGPHAKRCGDRRALSGVSCREGKPERDFDVSGRVESSQFAWSFQRYLYDCLHDYMVELFSRTPQSRDAGP